MTKFIEYNDTFYHRRPFSWRHENGRIRQWFSAWYRWFETL